MTMKHEFANTQIKTAMSVFARNDLGSVWVSSLEVKWGIFGALHLSKQTNADKDERDSVQIDLPTYSNFKAASKKNSIKLPLLLQYMVANAQT